MIENSNSNTTFTDHEDCQKAKNFCSSLLYDGVHHMPGRDGEVNVSANDFVPVYSSEREEKFCLFLKAVDTWTTQNDGESETIRYDWEQTKYEQKSTWQGVWSVFIFRHFLRNGTKASSSAFTAEYRSAIFKQVMNRALFPCHLTKDKPTFRIDQLMRLHLVFVEADTMEQAYDHVGSRFVTAEKNGPFGVGVYVEHHLEVPRSKYYVMAFMALFIPYPVAPSEMPPQKEHFLGKGIHAGYGAHVAFTDSRTREIVPFGFWGMQTSVPVVVVEPHVLFPIALIKPTT
eukprot:m.223987 g.223987  ORF g.223987 m.223987 type:complete len:287 (-) comp15947_c1_seq24:54-914(-)